MSTAVAQRATRLGGAFSFLRHLAEMTVAMMLGMLVFGFVAGSLLAAAGSSLEDARVEQPELFVLGMASAMSVPMVAWMRRGGHGWRSSAEMTTAMFVPGLALIGCYRLGAVAAGSVCPLACSAMIPAMAVAMLYRLDDYTHASRGHSAA